MLKKSLIFGSVALLLTALIALTGCPTEADDDNGSGGLGPNHIFGTVNVGGVQAAVNAAELSGRTLVLTDGVTLFGNEPQNILDFKGATVRIDGVLTVQKGTPVIIDASNAQVTWGEKAKIRFKNDDDAYIYRSDDAQATLAKFDLAAGNRVPLIKDVTEITGTDTEVAMKEYTLGAGGFPAHVTALYVTDKLTAGVSTLGSKLETVFALGEVDVTGVPTFVNGSGGVRLVSTATLTSSAGAVTIGVPSETVLSGVTVQANRSFSIVPATGAKLRIGKVEGPGGLTIGNGDTEISELIINEINANGIVTVRNKNGSTVSEIKIPNTADSEYYGNVVPAGNSGTLNISNGAQFKGLTLLGPGTVAFSDAVTFTGDATIANDATFSKAITLDPAAAGDITVTFNGNVNLLGGTVGVNPITFGGGSKAHKIVLAAGKQISIAGYASAEAVGKVTLTATGKTKISADPEGKTVPEDTEGFDFLEKKLLKVESAEGSAAANGFELSGDLKLLSAALSLGAKTTVNVKGALTLETSRINLAADSSDPATIKLGEVTIAAGTSNSGVIDSELDAEAAANAVSVVSLKPNLISGLGGDSALKVPTPSSGTNEITITVPASKTLTIAGANLNLAANVTLKAGAGNVSSIILQGGATPGILTLSPLEDAATVEWTGTQTIGTYSGDTKTAKANLAGKDVVATASGEEGTPNRQIGSISGGATDDATITTIGIGADAIEFKYTSGSYVLAF
jgi:hypothetical protein